MTRQALVVDDAATIRMYHGGILRDAGFEVTEAANGMEGLEATVARRFDVLLVDVNMPHMDGYSFVEAVRRDGPNRATPIIMVSTEDAERDVQKGYAAGASVYLGKPVGGGQLVALAGVLAEAARS